MTIPQTRYAKTGSGLRIAYQQWGSGPPCLIAPALISNIEIAWEHELYRRCLERWGNSSTSQTGRWRRDISAACKTGCGRQCEYAAVPRS